MLDFLKAYLQSIMSNPIPGQQRDLEAMRPTPAEYSHTPSIFATRGFTPDEARSRALAVMTPSGLFSKPMNLRDVVYRQNLPAETPNEVYGRILQQEIADALKKKMGDNMGMLEAFDALMRRRGFNVNP